MMRNYADADNIHARIHALRGRILSLKDYALLARDQVSVSEDPVESRERLFREQISPLLSIAGAHDKYAPLFLAYLRQYEAQNAKTLFARAAGTKTMEQWYDISPFAVLDKDLLQKKLSISEIKSILAGTYFAECFHGLTSLRQIEVRLDACAARNLYNASNLFSGEAKKEFQDMAARRMAVLTIIWSYRFREYYHFREEQILSYIKKFHDVSGGIAVSQVNRLEEDLNRYLEQQMKSTGQKPSVVDIEQYLEQEFYQRVSFLFHRDFHSIYSVMAYLWLLFYQIRNLFRILDGRRFGFAPEEILNKMICKA